MKSLSECRECGKTMDQSVETLPYDCGIDGIVVDGVHVLRCGNCGNRVVAIPRMAQLHREIAHAVARVPERLSPQAIRFLRTHLGLSSVEFSRFMGVDPATVSRWEREDAPTPMGEQSEKLLRVIVLTGQPLESYAPDEPAPLRFATSSRGWKRRAA